MLLSLTSTAGQISRVCLADAIPWIKLIKLALHYIIAHNMQVPCHDRSEVRKLYCTSSLSPVIEALKLVTVKVESWSQTLRGPGINVACRLCTHYITNYATTGDVVKFFIPP